MIYPVLDLAALALLVSAVLMLAFKHIFYLLKQKERKMSQFKYLEKTRVKKGETRDFHLNMEINGITPILKVLPTGQANLAYFQAALRIGQANKKRGRKKDVTVSDIDQQRCTDKKLFPLHVIKGWQDVINDKGQEAEFSEESCADFINGLDDFVFDDLRDFCSVNEHWIGEVSVEEIGKKS